MFSTLYTFFVYGFEVLSLKLYNEMPPVYKWGKIKITKNGFENTCHFTVSFKKIYELLCSAGLFASKNFNVQQMQ